MNEKPLQLLRNHSICPSSGKTSPLLWNSLPPFQACFPERQKKGFNIAQWNSISTEKCVFYLNRLNNWEGWETLSNIPRQQRSHKRVRTGKMCKVSESPSSHCWGSTAPMRPKPKFWWHIQAITLQKGNYSIVQELTPSRKWLQCRQAPQHSLCMRATNCRTLPCWSWSTCSAPSPH